MMEKFFVSNFSIVTLRHQAETVNRKKLDRIRFQQAIIITVPKVLFRFQKN